MEGKRGGNALQLAIRYCEKRGRRVRRIAQRLQLRGTEWAEGKGPADVAGRVEEEEEDGFVHGKPIVVVVCSETRQ
ncbi:hypothetical protein MRX96_053659 [Rhipicephalus microplus]